MAGAPLLLSVSASTLEHRTHSAQLLLLGRAARSWDAVAAAREAGQEGQQRVPCRTAGWRPPRGIRPSGTRKRQARRRLLSRASEDWGCEGVQRRDAIVKGYRAGCNSVAQGSQCRPPAGAK